jgi:hypothetical protein
MNKAIEHRMGAHQTRGFSYADFSPSIGNRGGIDHCRPIYVFVLPRLQIMPDN